MRKEREKEDALGRAEHAVDEGLAELGVVLLGLDASCAKEPREVLLRQQSAVLACACG